MGSKLNDAMSEYCNVLGYIILGNIWGEISQVRKYENWEQSEIHESLEIFVRA